jgi:hypothetical protein
MDKITDAQFRAMQRLAWYPEIWWHGLQAGTRDVLHRRGHLRETRRIGCSTRGHRHPGYVTLSRRGLRALTVEAGRRGESIVGSS